MNDLCRLPSVATPTVRLRRLATELRRLRDRSGLTWEQVSAQTRVGYATLFRAERARGKPQLRTLLALLDLYGVDDAEREALLELHRTADERGMHTAYGEGLPGEYPAYISFESAASRILTYQGQVVPGPLQTEEYARALLLGSPPEMEINELERRVRARMERQKLLLRTQPAPVELHAIVDEAVIRRAVGGPHVLREQVKRLAEDAVRPNVRLQVLPFERGAHASTAGSFVFLEFPEDPPLVYLEHMGGDVFLDSEAEVDRFRAVFEHLSQLAFDAEQSRCLLQET